MTSLLTQTHTHTVDKSAVLYIWGSLVCVCACLLKEQQLNGGGPFH